MNSSGRVEKPYRCKSCRLVWWSTHEFRPRRSYVCPPCQQGVKLNVVVDEGENIHRFIPGDGGAA